MYRPRPHLQWSRTWPVGDPDDFVAFDPDHPMMHARIYLSRVPAQGGGQWSWAVGERTNLGTGTAMTAREAALAAEAAWFANREREHGAPAPNQTSSTAAPSSPTRPTAPNGAKGR